MMLDRALDFADSGLCLESLNGISLSRWAIANRLKALGIPMPEGYEEFRYLESSIPSFWPDAESYSYLMTLRHRVLETE